MLRNTFLNRLRTQKRRPAPLELDDERDAIGRPGDPRHPEAALEVAELLQAIAALPDDQRDAVVAIDIVGLSYRGKYKKWENWDPNRAKTALRPHIGGSGIGFKF